jgi:hypothetical protein
MFNAANDGANGKVGDSVIDGLRQRFATNFRRYDVGVRFRTIILATSFSESIFARACWKATMYKTRDK